MEMFLGLIILMIAPYILYKYLDFVFKAINKK